MAQPPYGQSWPQLTIKLAANRRIQLRIFAGLFVCYVLSLIVASVVILCWPEWIRDGFASPFTDPVLVDYFLIGGCAIASFLASLVTLAVHLYLPPLRETFHSKICISYFSASVLFYLFVSLNFLSETFQQDGAFTNVSKWLSVLAFVFLYNWHTLMRYDIWSDLSQPLHVADDSPMTLICCTLLGWGYSALVLAPVVFAGTGWLLLPVCSLLFASSMNLVLFVSTWLNLRVHHTYSYVVIPRYSWDSLVASFLSFVLLAALSGLEWPLFAAASAIKIPFVTTSFRIIVSLHGVYLMCIYICKNSVYNMLKEHWRAS